MMVSSHNPTSNYMFHLHLASQKTPSGSNQFDWQSIKACIDLVFLDMVAVLSNYRNISKINNGSDQKFIQPVSYLQPGWSKSLLFWRTRGLSTPTHSQVYHWHLDHSGATGFGCHIFLVYLNQMMQSFPSFIESSPYNHIQPFLFK